MIHICDKEKRQQLQQHQHYQITHEIKRRRMSVYENVYMILREICCRNPSDETNVSVSTYPSISADAFLFYSYLNQKLDK